jgi:hypothetical protein
MRLGDARHQALHEQAALLAGGKSAHPHHRRRGRCTFRTDSVANDPHHHRPRAFGLGAATDPHPHPVGQRLAQTLRQVGLSRSGRPLEHHVQLGFVGPGGTGASAQRGQERARGIPQVFHLHVRRQSATLDQIEELVAGRGVALVQIRERRGGGDAHRALRGCLMPPKTSASAGPRSRGSGGRGVRWPRGSR